MSKELKRPERKKSADVVDRFELCGPHVSAMFGALFADLDPGTSAKVDPVDPWEQEPVDHSETLLGYHTN